MNREIIRQHIYVSGRVQGVGFRFRAMQFANQLKLAGWVRNLDDGRVEMEVEGEREKIDHLFEILKGDRFIRVDSYEADLIPVRYESVFQIR
ncbi:acylphosphatase [Clostridium boliviensis]|uniref:Acylphosphatase n=1 Tax=Clostridium boliviensis TaxID=318465 RepID=A0ABU4GMC7_9CLOT|nr:acylphosphatase [Clostridium boliviensis]MDW2798758.1 acylphosphatase [Clostridium boliviensis]